MQDTSTLAKHAARDIESYLYTLPDTIKVLNVEDDPFYREKDIDILLSKKWNGKSRTISIEIKADSYYRTGNYFLEIISNESKNTPGCFLYTEADFIYYYFLPQKELHILPMPLTRDWFNKNQERFDIKKTSTPTYNGFYITVGRIVPRVIFQNEVQGVEIIRL